MAKGQGGSSRKVVVDHQVDQWRPSRLDLVRYGVAAFENAIGLERDAHVLMRSRRYPRVAALSVIGCEEAGKALLLALAAFGRVREDKIPEMLRVLRFGPKAHATKHALSLPLATIGGVLPLVRTLMGRFARKMKGRPLPARFEMFAEALAKELAADSRILEQLLPKWTAMEGAIASVAEGEWQLDRDAGLYVDLKDGKLVTPSRITARVARAHLSRLTDTLFGLDLLIPAKSWTEEGLKAMEPMLPRTEDMEALERMWADVVSTHDRELGARQPAARNMRNTKPS